MHIFVLLRASLVCSTYSFLYRCVSFICFFCASLRQVYFAKWLRFFENSGTQAMDFVYNSFAEVNWQLVDQCHSSMSRQDVPDSYGFMKAGISLESVQWEVGTHVGRVVQLPPDSNLQSLHVEKRLDGKTWNLNMQSCTVNLNKLFSRFAQTFGWPLRHPQSTVPETNLLPQKNQGLQYMWWTPIDESKEFCVPSSPKNLK